MVASRSLLVGYIVGAQPIDRASEWAVAPISVSSGFRG